MCPNPLLYIDSYGYRNSGGSATRRADTAPACAARTLGLRAFALRLEI